MTNTRRPARTIADFDFVPTSAAEALGVRDATASPGLDRLTWSEESATGARHYLATPVAGHSARWAVIVTENVDGAEALVDDFGGAWWSTHDVENASGLVLCKGDCCA